MKIKPCMPKGAELIDELVKLEEEYGEMIEEIIAGDHEKTCREALDVMQVIANISCFNNIDGTKMKEYKYAQKMLELSIEHIGRSNNKYKNELLCRLIDEHYEKMERRKKEWGSGNIEG